MAGNVARFLTKIDLSSISPSMNGDMCLANFLQETFGRGDDSSDSSDTDSEMPEGCEADIEIQ